MDSNTNETLKTIYARRSIRTYENRPITDEQIKILLQAAMAAPSACAKDPWRFIVVKNLDTRQRIAQGLPNGKMLASAAVGLVVCGDTNAAHDQKEGYMVQDCSAAVENILVAAESLKLGACWLGVYPREERMKHIRTLFCLPEPIIPLACIALGYPAEKKESQTRYNETYVHYEKW